MTTDAVIPSVETLTFRNGPGVLVVRTLTALARHRYRGRLRRWRACGARLEVARPRRGRTAARGCHAGKFPALALAPAKRKQCQGNGQCAFHGCASVTRG